MEYENKMSELILEYTLSKSTDRLINWIIANELDRDEKQQILLALKSERIKQVLRNLGYNDEFLKTL